MNQDFKRYIEIVGQEKVKISLKEALKDATFKENWSLIKEITALLETYINFNENLNFQRQETIKQPTPQIKLKEITELEKEKIKNTLTKIISEELKINIEEISSKKTSWNIGGNSII